MATVSRVFGACRVLMTKAASSPAGVSSGREGKGILKVLPVSQPLAKFIGADEAARTTAVKKIWEHIKLNNLQVRVLFFLFFLEFLGHLCALLFVF